MVRPGLAEVHMAVGVLLGANLLASGAVICMKYLSKHEQTLSIMFYLNSFAFLLICALAYISWQTPDFSHLPYLIGIGAGGVASQFCRIRALKLSNPGVLAPLEYTRLLLAIPIGILLFEEWPDVWAYMGSAVIMGTTLYLALTHGRTTNA